MIHRASPLARVAGPLGARTANMLGRHPDLFALGLLLLAGLALRLAFSFRTPVFVTHDSVAYFQAGYELARGYGFDLSFKRTPGYPLFLSTVVLFVGEDLMAVAFVQHLLGLLTAALTYFLGRALFGRLAGFGAGLTVALSSSLVIYEHYVLAEAIFIPLLLCLALALTRAVRSQRAAPAEDRARLPWQTVRWLALVGLLLGVAGLSRPVGQALAFAIPPTLLVAFGSWRRAALGSLVVAVGMAAVVVPWMGRNAAVKGSFDTSGLLGQTLIGRIVRHDQGFDWPKPESPAPYSDPVKVEARATILRGMDRDLRPSVINRRLRDQFGWSEAEASSMMKEIAFEVLGSQWQYYIQSTIVKWRRLLWGEPEDFLGYHWGSRKSGELRQTWTSNASIAHLLWDPTPAQEADKLAAKALVDWFSPFHLRWPHFLLLIVGLIAGLRAAHQRWAVVYVVLLTLALTIPAAALVGFVPRYRYPADPFLALLIGAGLAVVVAQVGRLGALLRERAARPKALRTAARVPAAPEPSR